MQVEFRSHFSGKKSASYWPGNTVFFTHRDEETVHLITHKQKCEYYVWDGAARIAMDVVTTLKQI